MIVVSKNRGTEVELLTKELAIEDHVIYNESAGRNSPPPERKPPTRLRPYGQSTTSITFHYCCQLKGK